MNALTPWTGMTGLRVGVQALFHDENGPKGGIDIRCALTVRLPYRPSVRAEHLGENERQAFDEAFAVLDRQLARYAERFRDSRRRPKKYYAAKRLLGSSRETAVKPAPRAS